MKFDRDIIPSTRRAHQAAEWVRRTSPAAFEPFHRGLLERYWARGEDLHAWDVLRAMAGDVGLDGAVLQREVEAGHFVEPVEAALAEAAELGVHAVPTFLVADRFVIQGAQSAAVFEQAFARLGHSPRGR